MKYLIAVLFLSGCATCDNYKMEKINVFGKLLECELAGYDSVPKGGKLTDADIESIKQTCNTRYQYPKKPWLCE